MLGVVAVSTFAFGGIVLTVTVTTDPGFGIDAGGTAITILGNGVGDVTFTDNNQSAITGIADASGEAGPASIDENGVWGIFEGSHARFRPGESTSGAEYKLDTWRMRAGIDGLVSATEDGKVVAGLSGYYGRGDAAIDSVFGPGDIATEAFGFAAAATWYDNNGFYADGQGQVSWFISDLSSDWIGELASNNDGFGYALSLEAGQRFGIAENWTVIPQAQLVYSDVSFDGFTDPFGADVSGGDNDSLRGRVGVAFEHQDSWTNEQGVTGRFAVHGLANLYYELLDGASADVSGTEVSSQNDEPWAEIGFGGSFNGDGDRYSIYGQVSASSSLDNFGDSYPLSGEGGLRLQW